MDYSARFTQGSRKAIELAEKTARELGQNFVGTEHILAGLAGEGEGLAAHLLNENGLSYDQIVDVIASNKPDSPVELKTFSYTPRTKRFLKARLRFLCRWASTLWGQSIFCLPSYANGKALLMRLSARAARISRIWKR